MAFHKMTLKKWGVSGIIGECHFVVATCPLSTDRWKRCIGNAAESVQAFKQKIAEEVP